MDEVVFITDGNNEIGMGHVYQSKTFASYFKERAPEVHISFLTKSSDDIAQIIRTTGFETTVCNDDEHIYESLLQVNPKIIVVDKLDFSPDLARRIKENIASTFAIFTCVTDANLFADITVMGAMDSHFKNTKVLVNDGKTLSLHGPRYLILRPEFFKTFNSKDVFSGKVLLLLGGADPANITCSAVRELMDMDECVEIKAIIGRAFANRRELNSLIASNDSKSTVEVIENTTAVSDYMQWADVAIVSPGISFFEALKTKTPVIVFNQNQFQHDAWAEDMTTYDKEDMHLLPEMLRKREFVYPDDPRVVSMDIGNGVEELIQTILTY